MNEQYENISASYDVGIAKKYGINCAVLLNKLNYLVKYTSREDGYCWRTAKELEDELGLTRNQQDLAIKKLEEAGLIETKNTYIQGTQIKCKHFKVTDCNKRCKCDLLKSSKSGMLESSKSLYNNKTLIIKHSIYNNIVQYLNKKAKTKYTTSSNKTIQLIKARMNEGFTEDDFKQVIDNKCNDWLNNDKMRKYLRPVTLFGTKFESYLNEKSSKIIPQWFDKDLKKEQLDQTELEELEKEFKEFKK